MSDLIIGAKKYINNALFYAIASVIPISLLPFCIDEEMIPHEMFPIVVALLFWFCIVGETICLYKANKLCKLEEQRKKLIPVYRYGIVRFGRTTSARCADICLLVSIIVLFVLEIRRFENVWIQTIITIVLILSLQLHSIFNGEIYSTINKYMHRRKDK